MVLSRGSAPASSVWDPANDPKPTFDEVYAKYFAFVWRSLRQQGVMAQSLGDAAQDVFLVVHRRLAEFEGRAPIRSWLYGITVRVAQEHRRKCHRSMAECGEADALPDPAGSNPDRLMEQHRALQVVDFLLGRLDPEKREVFVLAEIEGLSAREISAALAINVNTVYSRLRVARQEFEQALARHEAKDRRSM